MPVYILEEIQAEAAALPLEKQMEVLDFVKFLALRRRHQAGSNQASVQIGAWHTKKKHTESGRRFSRNQARNVATLSP